MKIHRIVLLALSLAWSLSASAQWQWVDKDGRKVYSDRPPPADVPDKNVQVQPGGARPSFSPGVAPPTGAEKTAARTADGASAPVAAASALKPPSGQDKELEARRKEAEDAEAAKKKAEEAKAAQARAENCRIARQAKATMDSGIRVAQVDAKGERVIMDDAARAAEAQRAQKVMASDCK